MSDQERDSDNPLSDAEDSPAEEEEEVAVSKKRKNTFMGKNKKRKTGMDRNAVSMIDDAAVLSGEDDDEDDDDDDEGEDDVNDYIRDGFVVDDEDDKPKDGLEDSDDDDDDDESGDDNDEKMEERKRRRKVRRMRDTDRLDEEDLALINEARGITGKIREIDEREQHRRNQIKARSEAELRKGLFDASDDEGQREEMNSADKKKKSFKKNRAVETFDEDGMDDFIEYDDDEARDRYRDEEDYEDGMGRREGISEAQLNEANDIFGTDFLDFMAGTKEDGDLDDEYFEEEDGDDDGRESRRKYRERGVGVDLGMDSEDEESDEDELFASDDDDEGGSGLTAEQRSEALRLKKEKRQLQKEERRKAAAKKKAERRKAKLRRAFEPVQLIENFCTERDDQIRSKDIPERFFDWNTPFHGPPEATEEFSTMEEEEAEWIVTRIPSIELEFNLAQEIYSHDIKMDSEGMDEIQKKQREIITSIILALRYMHLEKLEPEFIRKYRQDYVTSPSVRENLYSIMDEDAEWDRIQNAKRKVEKLLDDLTKIVETDEALGADEHIVVKLKEDLKLAQERLQESLRTEQKIEEEMGDLDKNDDDDDLFGDDEDEEKNDIEITRKKDSLSEQLKTARSLVQVCKDQVAQITSSLEIAEKESEQANPEQRNARDASSKACKDKLWNTLDYKRYVASQNDYREVMDVYRYLTLVKEGTDAVRSKNALVDSEDQNKKRSRRFDRDYYRTCVSQGLRAITYQFALSPFRAGIKLQDNMTRVDGFSWDKVLPGEDSEDMGDPRKWDAPRMVGTDPIAFANDLVSSGELLLVTLLNNDESDDIEVNDALRGCRYLAAMELAYEPRIRKQLRDIYRANALLTSRPTSKGLDAIDPFHEMYGLHLLRNKKAKDHFPDINETLRLEGIDPDENGRKELMAKHKNLKRKSCFQYMRILKAEGGGYVKHYIHLPFRDSTLSDTDWYEKGDDYFLNRDNQNIDLLMNELQKIYLPSVGDTEEWNEERNKILRFALINFLLPQFETELKRDLRDAAVKEGIDAAGDNLLTMAMEGPYRPSHLLGMNRFIVPTGDLPIVGVCCSSDGKDASYLAAISERGELIDHLAIPAGQQVDGDKMRNKVINFLMQSRPAAIVVGSLAGLSCRLVARKLGALATQATEKWNNRGIQGQDEDDEEFEARMEEFRHMYPENDEDDSEQEWKCNVEMVDDNIAQLFGRSVRGKKEFPDSAVNLKCAISIARHAQNPLAELTYAWGVASDAGIFGTEMLYINIHHLQQVLPKTVLLREYERVLSRAVAEVGVDINLACKYDHLNGMLSFVPGLGPRKAASLKHSMDRIGGVVASRKEILAKRMVGPIVYNNSVPFLRIRGIDSLRNQFLHPLDDTRLHPDVYVRNNWATKIAIDALEIDNVENTSNVDKDDKAVLAIRDIMQDSRNEIKRLYDATKDEWERNYGFTFDVGGWNPKVNVPTDSWRDKVDELDLETFANIIDDSGHGKWLSHLTMIKWEFRLPFADPRKPMDPLDREKLFQLLTGENDQTICAGKEVTGKVTRISDFGAHLKLEGDVPAFIPLRNLTDGHVESAEDVVQIGSIVTAVITEVKKDHMSVDLSLKMEDFRKDPSSWERPASLPLLDAAFDIIAAGTIEKARNKKREERLAAARSVSIGVTSIPGISNPPSFVRSSRVSRRACTHPAFRNASNDEITRELLNGGARSVGSVLIRPSSKKADSLAVHWVVRPGAIKVIEVVEEDKDNDASIGNTLKIKDEVFGSIDELIARYVDPMNERVEELTSHRKFLNLSEGDVDEKLCDMKKQSPSGVFYFLCWNEKYPGYASLRFIFSTPRNHHIGIAPEGFTWFQKTYPKLDLLLNAFKQNPRGPGNVTSSRQMKPDQGSSLNGIAGGWNTEQQPVAMGGWGSAPTHLPVSLPPPPQQSFRPAPPSLPPPPQNRYPPAPPNNYHLRQ